MAELTLRLVVDGPGAISRSLLSVCDVLAASGAAREAFADCFPEFVGAELDGSASHLILDRFDLFVGEPVLNIAGGTVKCLLQPSDRYRMFVSALASNGQVAADLDFHGWLVLSVATRTSTVNDVDVYASPGDESTPKKALSDG